MATVAERAEERRRNRAAKEAERQRIKAEKQAKEQALKQKHRKPAPDKGPDPDPVAPDSADPDFILRDGAFSILPVLESQAMGPGAQVVGMEQVRNGKQMAQMGAGQAGFGGANVIGGQQVPQNDPAQQNNPAQQNDPANPQNGPAQQNNPAQQDKPGEPKPLTELSGAFDEDDDVEVEVNVDAKGGRSPHANFRNFLATDEVPESIFGYPVVQDESGYTEKDLEFFRRNPKAAGFYDLGDEETAEDIPPVMDLFGGDAGAYQEAFAQKRKDLVNSTAERQYKALLKFRDPDHRRRAEAYLYAALDSDARNAALLDEYNRQAEANRPSSRRGRAFYDEMIERARGRFAGGAWEKALGELVSPDWVPPAEAPSARPRQGGSFMSRAKEALEVAKELPELIAGGAERHVADVKETIGAAGAVLYAPNAPGAEMYDPASRAIRDGKTGQVKRTATDSDRTALREVDEAIGVRQALGAGETRGTYPGSLNNPGNVEKRATRRQGEVESPHRRWAKFATPQDGLREMADAMRQIVDVKLAGAGKDFTIRNFAEVYAPRKNKKGEKENDTDQYIRDISSDSGLDADTPLARDADSMAKLLRSVVRFESGYPHSQWFTDEEYREAAGKLKK